jgi:hypothetical protein
MCVFSSSWDVPSVESLGSALGYHPPDRNPGVSRHLRFGSPSQPEGRVREHGLEGVDGAEGEIDDVAPCLWNPLPVSFDGWKYQIQAYWSDADGRCWQPADPPAGT